MGKGRLPNYKSDRGTVKTELRFVGFRLNGSS